MTQFVATADYEVIDRAPLVLAIGDKVRLGNPDADWPGWIWVTTLDGRGSYVPQDHLQKGDDGVTTVCTAFHARDLSVQRGDPVTSLREVKGWHWCRRDDGSEGWLPSYLLRPSKADLAQVGDS